MYYYSVLAGSQFFHGDKSLTYEFDKKIPKGSVVQIPLRNKQVTGVVDGMVKKPNFTTKSIFSVLTEKPLPASSLQLLKWISYYYPSPVGALVSLFAPSFLLKIPKRQSVNDGAISSVKFNNMPELVPEQKTALKLINSKPQNSSILLHGETGSGKTRIYVELAKTKFQNGMSSIILTPEIGLTTQLVKDFEKVFGQSVVVTHSNLTESQRRIIWLKVLMATQPLIIVGPRSALFLPVSKLGLVVVDEAHEQAYKQEQLPKYNALRVAAKLAGQNKAMLVYGTATPNVAEYYTIGAMSKPIVTMTGMATGKSKDIGKVTLVSLRDRSKFNRNKHLSDQMIEAISKSLNNQEQSLIFLNRRGTARVIACSNCGWRAACPNCDLPLTYHGDKHQVICHTCGFTDSAVSACPICKSTDILFISAGTKAIVDELQNLFPKATIKRFDTDNLKADSLEQNYNDILEGKVDILVGTQMLGKGLDLPRLSTVGVVSADTSLSFPDFSSEERTFQMITQIVGRIGRGHRKGIAIIQTLNPDNKTILSAVNRDWQKFYTEQINERRQFGFPPFYHLLKLSYSSKSAVLARQAAQKLAKKLGGPIEVIGPVPSFFEKRGGLYTWQITVKAKNRKILLDIIKKLPHNWRHDIDPSDLL